MSRGRGGYIGFNRVPAASAINSAASGVWTLREAEALKRAGTWPTVAPGGVGSGLQLWLDASDASTLYDATSGGSLVAADGAVKRWEDKSGNDRHAKQQNSLNVPIRKTSILNGLDVLRFDGVDEVLAVPDAVGITRNVAGFTLLAVTTRTGNGTTFNAFVGAGSGSITRVFFGYNSGGDLRFGGRRLDADSFQGIDVTASGTTVAGGILDYANAEAYFILGTATTQRAGGFQTAGNTSDTDSGTVCIGASVDASDNYSESANSAPFGGDIAEIVAYDRALTSNEVSSLVSYLSFKWGIT